MGDSECREKKTQKQPNLVSLQDAEGDLGKVSFKVG